MSLRIRTAIFLCAALVAAPTPAQESRPGTGGDATLLPNGWRIAPAGRHVTVGDLPLSVVETPDGCCAIVSSGGYNTPTLTVVDIERMDLRQSFEPGNAWLGLAWSPDGAVDDEDNEAEDESEDHRVPGP